MITGVTLAVPAYLELRRLEISGLVSTVVDELVKIDFDDGKEETNYQSE